MELKDLVGTKVFDAIDFSTEPVKTWSDDFEDSEVCRFRLDGVIYSAIEDPSDGYRSSMRDLAVEHGHMKNSFEPIEVLCIHQDKDGEYGDTDDLLKLVDTKTGEEVLRVGTRNTDDYYPCYVANFHPEAMIINKGNK